MGQWFTIWTPTNNQEAAFILEDDMEVSPYFFTWAVRATEKYYANDVQQRGLHQQLLNAVTEHVGTTGETFLTVFFTSANIV